jgi:hypothetical protein
MANGPSIPKPTSGLVSATTCRDPPDCFQLKRMARWLTDCASHDAGLKFHGTTKCPTTWDQTGDQTKLHIYVTKFADKMEGEVEIDKLRLKLVDAERFSKIVTDVYEPIMSSIPGDSI